MMLNSAVSLDVFFLTKDLLSLVSVLILKLFSYFSFKGISSQEERLYPKLPNIHIWYVRYINCINI